MNTNLELIKKWVKALRSGEYTQGKKALRDTENNFCCLGVLCDITKEKLNLEWGLGVDEIYYMGEEKCDGVLPFEVSEYLGEVLDHRIVIRDSNSKIPEDVSRYLRFNDTYLTELNDDYDLTFNEIADILEEEFLK